MCKIQYKDGSVYVFTFDDQYGDCADLVITQRNQLNVKLNEKFKQGDILCHNPQVFEYDPTTKQAHWKHGVAATVALMDCSGTYEDSNIITRELGDRLSIEPVQVRSISFSANTYIHSIKKVGDEVDVNDFLVVFEDAEFQDLSSLSKDKEALDYLAKLNRVTPKAKFAGKIVKIEAYYSADISQMHSTLANVVKTVIKGTNEKSRFSRGSESHAEYPESLALPEMTKFKKVTFDVDTVVLRFFIQEEITSGVGDKIVFDSSLKSITGQVLEEAPTTESGMKIDAIFSGSSISNRIILSPFITGIGERILETLEDTVVDMYFKK